MTKTEPTTRRGAARRDRPRETLREERKSRWEKKRSERYDVYGDLIDSSESKSQPVDGRRLADDLRRIHGLTDDPIFLHALEVLRSYGLDQGSPIKVAKAVAAARLNRKTFDEFAALELMMIAEREAARTGKEFSIRDAAEEAVDAIGLQGASFDASVDDLRKRYAMVQKSGLSSPESPDFGRTRRRVFVRPEPGQHNSQSVKFPEIGTFLDDTAEVRRMIYDGGVSAVFGSKLP